jgi:beta-lactamase superfamily II metal-dependent hydrolase
MAFPIRAALLLTAVAAWAASPDRALKIYWIDVEGGAATLIVSPVGESVLIDTGESVERDATRIWQVATKVAGLRQIDHVVTTHWHSDHFGGVYRLSQRMPLKRLYANRTLPDTIADEQFKPFAILSAEYRKAVPDGPAILHPGDTIPLAQAKNGPSLTLQCLAANQKTVARGQTAANALCATAEKPPIDRSENVNSLVLLLKYGGFTFFDSGDLTKDMETALVCPVNLVGTVTLFQIGSHGIDVSNSRVLIESLRPRVVVVNNSASKGAMAESMKTLWAARGIETAWQVHKNLQPGVTWNTADEYIANMTEVNDKAEFIHAAVEPDGTFSVQVGLYGTRKTYRSR